MDNSDNTIKKVVDVVAVVAILILLFFLQKIIPKLPFEPPSFYCGRVTYIPLVGTDKEYDRCMWENTGPSAEVRSYVHKRYGSELNGKQEICVGEAIERYLSGDNLQKFLNGTPAIDLIGQNKSLDLGADMLKCAKDE